MTTKSCKAKARRLQNEVRDLIYQRFPDLPPDAVTCVLMGECGMDIKLSPEARNVVPFAFEVRNQEHLNVWQAFLDACRHAEGTPLTPCAVISRNRQPEPLAVVPLVALLRLARAASKARI